ncbi:hypothetical protein LCDVSa098R [Lymphocystis disease virus 3]|uniref:Uncharacterized protein n=1 Tax=Lymphocystis disease virus 3 TaxID=2560566 RepID=A0A1B2RW03_9VIRU|nr:hypothetical protein BZK12_gp098 [Lymphocystis disease virus Sa]AOC55182.1 hypothetical protein LCDVSa098R [Lymphocystis disease virus 3]
MFKCFYCERGFWYICLKCLCSKNVVNVLDMFINKTIKELTLLNGKYDVECLALISSLIKTLEPYALHKNFLFRYIPKQRTSESLLKEALQGLNLIFKNENAVLFERNLYSITELYNVCELIYVLNA